ncbi:MAG: hypothetical protein AAGA96_12915 [Verrucomicrobiota bacterium]
MRVLIPGLVAVALAALGVWFLVAHLAGDLLRWAQFKDAKEADIAAVALVNLSTKAGSAGKDYTTLEVLWSYKVDGERFESSSISIHRLRDDLGGFRRQLYERLISDDPGSCFHLSERPEEAVLDRSLRPATLMLSALFCFIPLGLAAFFWRAALYERRNGS